MPGDRRACDPGQVTNADRGPALPADRAGDATPAPGAPATFAAAAQAAGAPARSAAAAQAADAPATVAAPAAAGPSPFAGAGSAPRTPGRVAAGPVPPALLALGARPQPAAAGPLLTPDGIPKLVRSREAGVIAGVAAGIAAHLRVPVLWVRIAFALLALMAGSGVVAYALLWMFVPQGGVPSARTSTSPAERRQAIGVAAVGLALLIAGTALGFGDWVGWILGPIGLAVVGGAFIWREADDVRRARWRRTAAGFVGPSAGSLWRLIGGAVLVIGGLSVFALGQLDFTAVRSALIAVLLTLVGVAIITVPWWIRLVRDLGDERRERIRERERAEIAAHLHDSVLQTLALIQRQAADSREVLRLARGQERELRSWLYGPTGYAAPDGAGPAAPEISFAAALAAAAGEVEDTYAVAVAPVVVGDLPMDPHLAALVAAAREAMVNAAKHSGVGEVSVYAEIEHGTASVFVRDRGKGFDESEVGTDRRGLAESIRGRMDRHGGSATVRSQPGEGTEVELTMPVTVGAADEVKGSTA